MLSSFLNSPFERFSVEKYFAPNSDINWAYSALLFSSLSAFRVFWAFPCYRVCQIFFQSSRRKTILQWRLVKIWKEDSLLQKRKINWFLYRAFKLWRARVDMSIYAFWTKHCKFVRVSKVEYGPYYMVLSVRFSNLEEPSNCLQVVWEYSPRGLL